MSKIRGIKIIIYIINIPRTLETFPRLQGTQGVSKSAGGCLQKVLAQKNLKISVDFWERDIAFSPCELSVFRSF